MSNLEQSMEGTGGNMVTNDRCDTMCEKWEDWNKFKNNFRKNHDMENNYTYWKPICT